MLMNSKYLYSTLVYLLPKHAIRLGWCWLLFCHTLMGMEPGLSAHQNEEIEIIENMHISVAELLEQIYEQTHYNFIYQHKAVENTPRIPLKKGKYQLEELLNRIYQKTALAYEFKDQRTVVLKSSASENSRVQWNGQTIQNNISGLVTDLDDAPIMGVTVQKKNSNVFTTTDDNGFFSIPARVNDTLIFSHLGFLKREIVVDESDTYDIILVDASTPLNEVELVSTGYQRIEQKKVTGALEKIDEDVLEQRINQNILSKIEGEINGLLFDSRVDGGISIRGIASIYSNTQPLIVVDGFPIEGDINTINPNDVKSISVLKDAAAAAIWGIRSANGVIVITTKKGDFQKGIQFSFNINSAFQAKPDLRDNQIGDSNTQIAYQRALIENGYYTPGSLFSGDLNQNSFFQLNAVAETLLQQQRGDLSPQQANEKIAEIQQRDSRRELSQLLLRPKSWQQINTSISGGSEKHHHRASLNIDRNVENISKVRSNRVNLYLDHTFRLHPRITFQTSTNLNQNKSHLNPITDPERWLADTPVTSKILDENNEYIPMPSGANRAFSNLAQSFGFPYSWTYNIKQELDHSQLSQETSSIRFQSLLTLKLLEEHFSAPLKLHLGYQYENSAIRTENLRNDQTYFTRNLVNRFSQLGSDDRVSLHPIPKGNILDILHLRQLTHTFRSQLNYSNQWKNRLHQLDAILGLEVRTTTDSGESDRKYGYSDQSLISVRPDYNSIFSSLVFTGEASRIPSISNNRFIENRYVSYYSNFHYTYQNIYTLSATIRLDDTNLFGSNPKYRNIPLYSLGLGWNVARSDFFSNEIFKNLDVRIAYGINGNVNRQTSPYLRTVTFQNQNSSNTGFNHLASFISTPPNPNLRLEKTKNLNISLDFGLLGNINRPLIEGGISYYQKNSEDLLVENNLNPTLGLNSTILNVGALENRGVEIRLGTNLGKKEGLQLNSTLRTSRNENSLSKIKTGLNTIDRYLEGSSLVNGQAINTLYSYRYAGLDARGNPQFFDAENQIIDYTTNLSDPKALQNMGPLNPIFFGSWINRFSYKNLSLRIVGTFKAGHVFRNLTSDYIPSLHGHNTESVAKNFSQRWQKSGDENITRIPRLPSITESRNFGYTYYQYSDAFVDSASHIRLRQIHLSYSLPKAQLEKIKFKRFSVGLQSENLQVWNFNRWNIDPEFPIIPLEPTFTLNINASF